MTGLIIHPAVSDELVHFANWYRAIDYELAERFLDEVYHSIRKAQETPLHYRIIFEVIESIQAVHIVAVTHQMRHPDHWRKRL